jgi:hypothetical protein
METHGFARRDVLTRTDDFRRRIEGLRLRPYEWELLFAIDGRATLGELADRFDLEFSLASDLARRFEAVDLVVPLSVTLDEYLRGYVAPPPETPAPSEVRRSRGSVTGRSESEPVLRETESVPVASRSEVPGALAQGASKETEAVAALTERLDDSPAETESFPSTATVESASTFESSSTIDPAQLHEQDPDVGSAPAIPEKSVRFSLGSIKRDRTIPSISFSLKGQCRYPGIGSSPIKIEVNPTDESTDADPS